MVQPRAGGGQRPLEASKGGWQRRQQHSPPLTSARSPRGSDSPEAPSAQAQHPRHRLDPQRQRPTYMLRGGVGYSLKQQNFFEQKSKKKGRFPIQP